MSIKVKKLKEMFGREVKNRYLCSVLKGIFFIPTSLT